MACCVCVLSARAVGGEPGRLRPDVPQHEGEMGRSDSSHGLHPPVQARQRASAGEGGRPSAGRLSHQRRTEQTAEGVTLSGRGFLFMFVCVKRTFTVQPQIQDVTHHVLVKSVKNSFTQHRHAHKSCLSLTLCRSSRPQRFQMGIGGAVRPTGGGLGLRAGPADPAANGKD